MASNDKKVVRIDKFEESRNKIRANCVAAQIRKVCKRVHEDKDFTERFIGECLSNYDFDRIEQCMRWVEEYLDDIEGKSRLRK